MVFGFGRIEFDGNFINLDRPWSDFQPRRPVNRSSVQAESGIEQTITKFSQWFINARLNLLNPQEKAQLQRLFEYAEDGSSFTLIRDRNLGAYINFEGGINPAAAPRGLKTNDDVDGTFTRTNVADSAWYLDEGTGLLTLRDGADVPRFPAGKYGAGIQIDGAAVNLLVNRISNAAWTKTGMTAVTTTETLDPAGNNSNVDKLTATGALGNASQQTSTPKGNNAAASIWLKSSVGNVSCRLQISGTTGTDFITITVTPEWTLFSHTADTSGFTGDIAFVLFIVTNTEFVYSWHTPQLFDSAEFSLGTVGALSTSSITRNAEKLTFPTVNVFDSDKVTVLFWHNPLGDAGGSRILLDVDGVTGRRMHIERTNSAAFNVTALDGAGGVNSITAANNSLNVLSWDNHIGFSVDSTISNGIKIYYNGTLLATDVNNPFDLREPGTVFNIGKNFHPYGAYDDILIVKNILTLAEIAGIHALGIGLGVPRNRWTVQLNDQVWNPRWRQSDIYDIPLLLKEVLT